jgi:hypothetical protein
LAVVLPTDQVFINCPFDEPYAPTFRALVFTIFATEFRPRSALELEDGGQSRMDKLFSIIEECRYGVHDISRTDLDPVNHLPRFNMPFELGIFFGARTYGGKQQKLKRALVLDIEQYRYQRFISDLAGYDIRAHEGEPTIAVRILRDWLANVSRRKLPSANWIEALYQAFVAELPGLAAAGGFDPDEIPYVDYEQIVVDWLVAAPAP